MDDVFSDSAIERSWAGAWMFLVLALGLLLLLSVGAVALYEFTHLDRIYHGVTVAAIPLGGLTIDEASTAIADALTPYPGKPITLRADERLWLLSPSDLGVSVDAREAALRAYEVGRAKIQTVTPWAALRSDLVDQWNALRHGHPVNPSIYYDENSLAYALKRVAREVDLPPKEGALTITGLEVFGTAGVSGQQVDVATTHARLIDLLRRGEGGTVDLVTQERPAVVTSVETVVASATALLAEPLLLTAQTLDGVQRFSVDRGTLRDWLILSPALGADGTVDLAVSLDREAVAGYLAEIAASLDRRAHDARLDYDPVSNQVIVLSTSQPGQLLAGDSGLAALESALLGDEVSRDIGLPVTRLEPKVDSTRIDEMGIVELVSQGTTYFRGSSRDRVHNIVTAAEKFNGVVIPPEEEFSFNAHVGDVTAANGFADSLIIWGDRTAVGIGGGVCQVSTTAFRAAFFGGFPIAERWAHGYIVSWYGEPGLDATIYTPDVDFRFRNDTGHYLLIKPEVDTAQGSITFYFYGTRPDRTVETAPAEVSNVREPEKPLYQEDDSLPTGVIKQVDWAKEGKDVVIKRRVVDVDGSVDEQAFESHYQPWRAVFLYGPGAKLPPDALSEPNQDLAPTPEPTPDGTSSP